MGDPQPPERPPFGRGAGRCGEVRARAKKIKGLRFIKKKCKGFPHTHEKYLKASHCTPVVRSLAPPERGKSAHKSPVVVRYINLHIIDHIDLLHSVLTQ